uniref:Potassium channel domain-containing protein n=1 Tax=Haptolina brevifila TaxID=156173 RepID=A0A7S2HF39_9EUKA|mmetsp:Transcript_54092/g.107453  ORF Transcript_54092/g.107453 Transcript_54092/m.107453 type:complete len:230 (+) Transcript_54092:200-889(+)
MTTVGYGDITPLTWGGKMLTCICIVIGVLFMAMPISIVGSAFATAWEEMHIDHEWSSLHESEKHTGNAQELVSTFSEAPGSPPPHFSSSENGPGHNNPDGHTLTPSASVPPHAHNRRSQRSSCDRLEAIIGHDSPRHGASRSRRQSFETAYPAIYAPWRTSRISAARVGPSPSESFDTHASVIAQARAREENVDARLGALEAAVREVQLATSEIQQMMCRMESHLVGIK